MSKKNRYILACSIIVLFYIILILEKIWSQVDVSVNGLFLKYLPIGVVGIAVIYLINRYVLKETVSIFFQQKNTFIIHLTLGLMLLSIMYFIISLGNFTYFRWIPTTIIDNSEIVNTLTYIISDTFYTIILLGPFIWISEIFSVLSRAFLLNNLWKLNKSKTWNWFSISIIALLFALTQIDKGIPTMINTFLIIFASNVLYFKYPNITPLLIASIVIQTVDLVAFWFYNS
jgi:Type II CAAX prenyl endopeptidase Rce1-like